MKLLVTTHAQLFKTPDGKVWTKSVYGYDFFKRYLEVFDEVRLVGRLKEAAYEEVKGYLCVDGENFEIFPLPFYRGPWEYAKTYFKIKRQITKAIDGCECAILRIPDQFSFQLYNKLKQKQVKCAVEVVAHPWDLFAPGNNKTILRSFLRYYWDYKQKQICAEALGVSYVTKNYIQLRYPSNIKNEHKDRIQSTYTSADIDESFYYRARNQDDFIDDNILKLVHVSGINDNAKGHEVLLKVMVILKKMGFKFKLTFVGGGVLLNHFEKLRDKMGLSNEVVFTGNIAKRSKITEILISSDLFIFPSMSEGLPRVVIEAMATGLPCIASDVGGTSELISDRFLIRNPKSVEEIVNLLLKTSKSRELLAEESSRNFSHAKEEYSAKNIQSKRKQFYSKVRLLTEKQLSKGGK